MTTRRDTFEIGEYYHIYNRGVDKRIIFNDKFDYQYFLSLLFICNTEKNVKIRDLSVAFDRGNQIVDVGAYCLMPNHFHILLKEKIEGGISKYMLKVSTAYSMYFNSRNTRTGKLYEGTFKSTHINSDRYLKYIYSYIHLNPAKLIDKNWREVKTKIINELLEYVLKYPYSSINELIGLKSSLVGGRTALNTKVFPEYFTKPIDHKSELFGWLKYEDGN